MAISQKGHDVLPLIPLTHLGCELGYLKSIETDQYARNRFLCLRSGGAL